MEKKTYRNVFLELGLSEEEIAQRVQETFDEIFYGENRFFFFSPDDETMGYMEDTGNHDALLDAADFVAAFQKRQGLYISCIEEIAYKRGFISKEQLIELAQPLLKTAYGQYLLEVAEGL